MRMKDEEKMAVLGLAALFHFARLIRAAPPIRQMTSEVISEAFNQAEAFIKEAKDRKCWPDSKETP